MTDCTISEGQYVAPEPWAHQALGGLQRGSGLSVPSSPGCPLLGLSTDTSLDLWSGGVPQCIPAGWKAVRKPSLSGGGVFQGNLERRETFPVVVVVRLKAGKNFPSLESKMRFFTSYFILVFLFLFCFVTELQIIMLIYDYRYFKAVVCCNKSNASLLFLALSNYKIEFRHVIML